MAGRKLLVAGDVGGTNARLAAFDATSASAPERQPCVYRASYKNEHYDKFNDLVTAFLRDAGVHTGGGDAVESVCFAVAGPVSDNRVTLTNREQWLLDANDLRHSLNVPCVRFVNDFAANGYGLLTLDEHEECFTLNEGVRDVRRPIACLGAGTGLGECFLTPSDMERAERMQTHGDSAGARALSTELPYDAYPTEGGHVEFAPRDELESEMLRFLQRKFSESGHRVSVERIVSGRGLVSVYEFLRQKYPQRVDERHDHAILSTEEGGALVARYAHESSLCAQAMRIMMSVFGAEAGNVALKYLPYGGLYIAGGIAPKNLDRMRGADSEFLRSFFDKGRVSQILNKVPVKVVLAEDLGLRGAHVAAARAVPAVRGDTVPAVVPDGNAQLPAAGAFAAGAAAGGDDGSGRHARVRDGAPRHRGAPTSRRGGQPTASDFKPLDIAVYATGIATIASSVAFAARAAARHAW